MSLFIAISLVIVRLPRRLLPHEGSLTHRHTPAPVPGTERRLSQYLLKKCHGDNKAQPSGSASCSSGGPGGGSGSTGRGSRGWQRLHRKVACPAGLKGQSVFAGEGVFQEEGRPKHRAGVRESTLAWGPEREEGRRPGPELGLREGLACGPGLYPQPMDDPLSGEVSVYLLP